MTTRLQHRGTVTRRVAAAMLAAAASLVVAASAGAQENPRRISRDPSHGPIGTTINVRGEGCIEGHIPDETAHIYLIDDRGSEHGFYRGDKVPIALDGTFSGTVTVPDEATPGPHTVSVDCQHGDRLKIAGELPFTVDAPIPTRTPTPTRSARPTPTMTRPTRSASPTPPRTATTWPTRSAPATTATPPRVPTPTGSSRPADPANPAAPTRTSPTPVAADTPTGPPRNGPGAVGAAAAALIAANTAALLRLRRPTT